MVISEDETGIELQIFHSLSGCKVLFDFPINFCILTFKFSKEYLKAFDGDYNLLLPIEREKDICCSTMLILHEIFNSKRTGLQRSLFMESKAIDLLLCFVRCSSAEINSCDSCKFLNNPYEKEKIIQARDILLRDIQLPPTIPQLASQVGINQCYLKKGFKEVFNTTIFAFIQEHRISRAKLLLTTTQNSIADIASEVGFSNTSNFTNSFKTFTGVLPSDLRSN